MFREYKNNNKKQKMLPHFGSKLDTLIAWLGSILVAKAS
jgi:hypothetical protein